VRPCPYGGPARVPIADDLITSALAQGRLLHGTTVLIWLIFSSANGVKLSSGREGQVRVLVRV